MIPLKVLLAAPFFLPVQGGEATGGCLKYKNYGTELNFKIEAEPIKYNFRSSRKALTAQSRERTKSWVDKHQGHEWVSGSGDYSKWHTNGVTKGSMRVETRAELVAMPYDRYGAYYCPYVKSLDVTVYYKSEIAIASEIKEGTCEFAKVMEHEMKHHNANTTVVEILARQMELDAPKMIDFMEERYVSRDKAKETFKLMKEGLRDAMNIYGGEISERMKEFNGHIDTPEEYRTVSLACAQQKKK